MSCVHRLSSSGQSSSTVQVHVLVFAAVQDRLKSAGVQPSNNEEANKYHVTLKTAWSSSSLLRAFICGELWPCLQEIEPTIALALNLRYVDPMEPIELKAGDTLALIPPISGG